jgi:hypothetical protein
LTLSERSEHVIEAVCADRPFDPISIISYRRVYKNLDTITSYMGFIGRLINLFGGGSSQQSAHEASSVSGTQSVDGSVGGGPAQLQASPQDDWAMIEYQAEQYYCEIVESQNGQYQVAYADGRYDEEKPIHGVVFLFENGNRICTMTIERPNEVAVSNTGTVAVVDWEFGWENGELSGTFHVYDHTGSERLTKEFDSNVGPCAVTSDGHYTAVSTLSPDCSTYLFDTETGDLLACHENEGGNKQKLAFEDTDGEWRVSLAEELRDEPTYAIDLSGNVVWHNEQNNLRGDVGELVEQVGHGDGDYDTENDLCTIARRTPEEIIPYLSSFLDLIEQGAFKMIDQPGGQLSVNIESVFTSVAKNAPEEYEVHTDRLVANIQGATTPAAAVVSTSVIECLANQELVALESHYDDFLDLLHHERRDVRHRAVTILASVGGRMYDQNPVVADRLVDNLQSQKDLLLLRGTVAALTTLLDKRPSAIERMEPAVPRAIELLTVGDPDYQYGDIDTYDYKNQTHYETNHLHRTVPPFITKLAPRYADQFTGSIPALLTLLSQPGQRNTSLRSASHSALTAIVNHSTGDHKPVLESEFDRIVTLLESGDMEVRITAVELFASLETHEAREQLITLQEHADDELVSTVSRALRIMDTTVSLAPEVTRLTPTGDDAIERQQNRFSIQRAYEFLQAEGSARKQEFIEAVYSEDDSERNTEQWWRMVRAGFKSMDTVELDGTTYRYLDR